MTRSQATPLSSQMMTLERMYSELEDRHYELSDKYSKLLEAASLVCECIMLENMQRPSFTFRRIEKLHELITRQQNDS